MKRLGKYTTLLLTGGIIYLLIELLYRGYSHWTMFILGAVCFNCLGLINEILSWETPLWKQMIIGGVLVTILEFVTGCIINLWLQLNVWNYSSTPFNLLGQICLPFFFIWCVLSIVGIILDDYLRYWLFNEEKPRYKLF